VSDIDTVAVDSLKALDPNRPIREADIARLHGKVALHPVCRVSYTTEDYLSIAGARRTAKGMSSS
jgi:hypothetical protein